MITFLNNATPKEINYRGRAAQRWTRTGSIMASYQFLLSGEAGVTTSAATYDKSDEALLKVVQV